MPRQAPPEGHGRFFARGSPRAGRFPCLNRGALMVEVRDSLDVRPRRSVRPGLFWLLRQRFPFTAIAPGSPAAPDVGFPNGATDRLPQGWSGCVYAEADQDHADRLVGRSIEAAASGAVVVAVLPAVSWSHWWPTVMRRASELWFVTEPGHANGRVVAVFADERFRTIPGQPTVHVWDPGGDPPPETPLSTIVGCDAAASSQEAGQAIAKAIDSFDRVVLAMSIEIGIALERHRERIGAKAYKAWARELPRTSRDLNRTIVVSRIARSRKPKLVRIDPSGLHHLRRLSGDAIDALLDDIAAEGRPCSSKQLRELVDGLTVTSRRPKRKGAKSAPSDDTSATELDHLKKRLDTDMAREFDTIVDDAEARVQKAILGITRIPAELVGAAARLLGKLELLLDAGLLAEPAWTRRRSKLRRVVNAFDRVAQPRSRLMPRRLLAEVLTPT
jgi:hypothetical protein